MRRELLQGHYYPETAFGGFTAVDGTVAFYVRVQALAEAAKLVLDVGCGRGVYGDDGVSYRRRLRDLRGPGRRVVGIDVDPDAATNPLIDEFRAINGRAWPIENASVDVCLSDCVLEHLVEPDLFFSEAKRVLKIGGCLCLRTTNAWSYVAVASKLLPNALHAAVLSKVQDKREERDVFPTTYRCNSIGKIRKALRRHGFTGIVFGHEAEPSYLSFSRAAYLLGVIHQRLAPSFLAPTLFAYATSV